MQRGNVARMRAIELKSSGNQALAAEFDKKAQTFFRLSVAELNKAITVDPKHRRSRESLAHVSLFLTPPDHTTTTQQYEWYRKNGFHQMLDPVAMWRRMAGVELDRGDYSRALKFIRAARRGLSHDLSASDKSYDVFEADIFSRWAIKVFESGRQTEAFAMMRHAIELSNDADFGRNLAIMYEKAGDLARAEAQWSLLVKRQPSNRLYRDARNRVRAQIQQKRSE